MAIASDIISDINVVIEEHGIDITAYLSPTYSYDDEGGITSISLGTDTSAKSIIFTEGDGETFEHEEEGVEELIIYRIYLKSSIGTITKKSVFFINNEYFRIVAIKKHPLEDQNVTYYEVVVERLPDQDVVTS